MRYSALDSQLTLLIHGEPAIIIDPSLITLIAGLSGQYCFKRLQVTGEERYRDNPDKGATSHVCESLHYLLMGAGEAESAIDTVWGSETNEVESQGIPDSVYE